MLNYLNEKFIYTTNKTKIELYILPILIVFLFYIFLQENKEEKISSTIDNYLFENKKMEENFLEIISKIENLAKKNSIFIIKSEKKEPEIILVFSGELNDIFEFLMQIERLNNFSNIKFISYKKEQNKNIVNLRVDFSKFFIKKFGERSEKLILNDSLQFSKDEKIAEETIEDNLQNEQKVEFEISAIIGQYAFINNIWVKKDEQINSYKLTKIYRDYVILEKESLKIKLELSYAKHLKNSN